MTTPLTPTEIARIEARNLTGKTFDRLLAIPEGSF